MPLELDDSSTKAVREDDGTGEGEILDNDDSNDSPGDGGDIDIEWAGLVAVTVATVGSTDVTGDCGDGFEISFFVVVVGEDDDEDSGPGEVAGEVDFSGGECDGLRMNLLGVRLVAFAAGAGDGVVSVRVVLTLPLLAMVVGEERLKFLAAGASGLAIVTWMLPDLLRTRCRSVDEWRVSVDSSCCARFRFDLRLADLSRSINLLPLPLLLLTGLRPPISLPISGKGVLAPDFMVEVLIRGVGGDSKLLKFSTMESNFGGRRGS